MAITVTATEGANAVDGILLRVKVLTGAAAAALQAGATKTADTTGTPFSDQTVTTTTAGSVVYGAMANGVINTAFTADARTTFIDQVPDASQICEYASWRATAATGTPGATVLGATAPTNDHGTYAAAEILAAGTIAEDGSGPAAVSSTSLTAITSASFTPPPGSLLVAIVAHCSSAVSSVTITNSGTALTWHQRAYLSTSAGTGSGVWVADVPGAGPTSKLNGLLGLSSLPPAVVTEVAPLATLGGPRRRSPHRAAVGARGALAAGILATGIAAPAVPAAPAPHHPPPAIRTAPHRALWRSGAGQAPAAPAQRRYPVTIFRRTAHRAAWDGGQGAAPAAQRQPAVPPRFAQRVPHRAAWDSVAGTPPAVTPAAGLPQPSRPVTVFPRRPHGAAWRAAAGQPPAAARQPRTPPTVFTRATRRAAWRGGTGPAVIVVPGTGTPQPARPVTIFARRPHRASWDGGQGTAPAARPQPYRPVTILARAAHRALWHGGAGPAPAAAVAGSGLPQPFRPATVYRRAAHAALWRAAAGRPPAAARQPRTPATVFARAAHRVTWRAVLGPPGAPPPPFTVGVLTGADAPAGVLTAAAAASALTAATAAAAAITATDQRTGGPS